jgi:hypothetical protein
MGVIMRPARCLMYLYSLIIIKPCMLTGTGKGNAIMSATIITTQRQGMRQFRTD